MLHADVQSLSFLEPEFRDQEEMRTEAATDGVCGDDDSSLFADTPGLLLPAQYHDLIRRGHVLDGELRLMFAVLEDAIHCYLKNMHCRTESQRNEFREVCNWFETPSDTLSGRQTLFGFENLCEALGMDAKRLRDQLVSIRVNNRTVRRFRRAHRALGGLAQPSGRPKELPHGNI